MSLSSLEENLNQLQDLRERFRREPIKHLIDGEWVSSSNKETFINGSPIDESIIGEVALGTQQDVDEACQAAHTMRSQIGRRCREQRDGSCCMRLQIQ